MKSSDAPHILFVEDDETLGFVTKDNLEHHGFLVTHMINGREALQLISALDFDLALLDVMLPEVDGFEIGREIRRRNDQVPILYLTAKSLKEDRLHGFGLGADDYITKPFSIEELIFRINVFLRRHRVTGTDPVAKINLGSFIFDHANLTLASAENSKLLTEKEADLLHYLVRYRDKLCKRSDILERIWGENDYFMGRSLDVFISRLRKYLAADDRIQIKNIHGVGFKLSISE